MKKIIITLAAVAAIAFSTVSCGAQDAAKGEEKGASKADVSYAFGVAIGTSLKETGVEMDYAKFVDGIKDVIEKDKPKISMEEAQVAIQSAIMQAMQKIAEKNSAAEAAFMAENGKKAGIVTTDSGLQYEIITQGTGARPLETDTVRVDYVGTFLDGKQFDSSIESGEPAVFPVAMVIPGWVEGIQLMPVGSKYKFYIPSALAYGQQGSQGGIQPNTTLIFEVELLSIEPPADAQ
ncbi:MAG: FKBP-type peptidyl-prolyl cis-trans isomerase [Spirochaetes bacterium]|nr:FKBP-type peptidyl-prolyl cis-trans isomerase [Spirochaetota bacterium]MBU1081307.1 FKBP-type peptidyl-prolyl cis-trans isomerase [Spirochaetota bacterium]